MKVKAGQNIIDTLILGYKARKPVLLEGRHGVGKSEMVLAATKALDIDFQVINLAMMDGPDLLGLPRQEGGRTVYSPPSFIPTSGSGIILFDEISRCEKHILSPVYQILTERKFHETLLPEGWVCMGACNPSSDSYDVNTLDPALLSRFIRVEVVPDVKSWTDWGTKSGIHPAILRYVSITPNVFDSESSNPRAWAYASDIIKAYEQSGVDDENLLVTSVAGLLGDSLAIALIQSMLNEEESFSPDEILESYEKCRSMILHWVTNRKIANINSCVHGVQVRLQSTDVAARVASMATLSRNLETFIKDVPADMGKKLMKAAKQSGAVS